MQQELQGTVWQEHAREHRDMATHPQTSTPCDDPRASQVREACELVERELDRIIHDSRRPFMRLLWLMPALLLPAMFMLVALLSSGTAADNPLIGPRQIEFIVIGALLILPIATFVLARRYEHAYRTDPLMLPDLFVPQLQGVNRSLARTSLDRRLNSSGIAEQLIGCAMRGQAKLPELLIRLGHSLSLDEQGALNSRGSSMVLLASMLSAGSLLLAASVAGLLKPGFTPAAVLLLLIGSALLANESWRFHIGLRLAEAYLRSTLHYYRELGSLRAERFLNAAVPGQVQVEQGSGRLAKLSIELAADLARRGSWPGWSIPLGVLSPLLFPLAAAAGYLAVNLLHDGFWEVGVTAGATAVLLYLVTRLLADHVNRQAARRMEEVQSRVRQLGLVNTMAMGLLPVDELLESCPVFLRRMLYLPSMPRQLRGTANEQAWLLMWNADWFCGERVPMVRLRWHSNWLIPVTLLPASLLLGFGTSYLVTLLLGFSYFTPDILQTSCLLLALLLTVYLIHRSMLEAARHLAGAWAVVRCMEELVQEGEGDGS
ncbi:hypothetical protein KDL44_11000 [bacterium]|nr:hypothetical protein [bacterium]